MLGAKRCYFLVFLMSSVAYGQDGLSSEGMSAAKQSNASAISTKTAVQGMHGSEKLPLVVQVVQSASEESNAKRGAESSESQADSAWWMVWITLFMSVVAGIQAVLFLRQLRLMVITNDVAHAASQLSNPPDIRVTNIQIWPSDGQKGDEVVLLPGKTFKVSAHAVNVGNSTAYLCGEERNVCMAFLYDESKSALPMFRPFKEEGRRGKETKKNSSVLSFLKLPKENEDDGINDTDLVETLPSGKFGRWTFEFTLPEDFQLTKSLYVMGLIAYWDHPEKNKRKRRRLRAFARKLDVQNQVFLTVDEKLNSDYECVE